MDDWKQYADMDLSSKLVHYIPNRILVGSEICRKPDYRTAAQALSMSRILPGSLWIFLSLVLTEGLLLAHMCAVQNADPSHLATVHDPNH